MYLKIINPSSDDSEKIKMAAVTMVPSIPHSFYVFCDVNKKAMRFAQMWLLF